MATEIPSRSSVQCRSHHQKMVQVYGEPLEIIAHYEDKVIPYYKVQLKEWKESIKPEKPSINFCVMFQNNNSLKI
mgnify:CR=1 FL=1